MYLIVLLSICQCYKIYFLQNFVLSKANIKVHMNHLTWIDRKIIRITLLNSSRHTVKPLQAVTFIRQPHACTEIFSKFQTTPVLIGFPWLQFYIEFVVQYSSINSSTLQSVPVQKGFTFISLKFLLHVILPLQNNLFLTTTVLFFSLKSCLQLEGVLYLYTNVLYC